MVNDGFNFNNYFKNYPNGEGYFEKYGIRK